MSEKKTAVVIYGRQDNSYLYLTDDNREIKNLQEGIFRLYDDDNLLGAGDVYSLNMGLEQAVNSLKLFIERTCGFLCFILKKDDISILTLTLC